MANKRPGKRIVSFCPDFRTATGILREIRDFHVGSGAVVVRKSGQIAAIRSLHVTAEEWALLDVSIPSLTFGTVFLSLNGDRP